MDEYVSLAEAQGGRCAICRQPETHRDRSGSVQPLGVDHDHRTGKVRGLLCHSCNTALGYFRDDPALLTAAAEYVMLWNITEVDRMVEDESNGAW